MSAHKLPRRCRCGATATVAEAKAQGWHHTPHAASPWECPTCYVPPKPSRIIRPMHPITASMVALALSAMR